MSQRNNNRNRNRNRNHGSNSTGRESSSHPYWCAVAHYFIGALRASTSTLSTFQASSSSLPPTPPTPPSLPSLPSPPLPTLPPSPPSPLSLQSSSFPVQPPPQNPYHYPNPINPPYIVCDNYILPLNFTTESIDNFANIFRDAALSYQNINFSGDNVELHTSNSSSSSSSSSRRSSSHQTFASGSRSHITSVNEYDEIRGKGRNFSHSAYAGPSSSPISSSLNFSLNSFPYTLSSLERYEIQIRIEGKITPVNIISPRQLNKLLINCKKDHKSGTNSQGNIYCKKRNNVYHYHNLSNASFYSKREDGSSIYVDQFGEITYKTKDQEDQEDLI
jgi:hypothetical protein